VRSEKLRDLVFLAQTDTTIGFLSQNAQKLTQIKERPPHKYYIKALPSLHVLKTFTRVPDRHKNRVRRAKRSTFVFPDGHSYRVVRDSEHLQLIEKFGWMYTTSANLSGEAFDEIFARKAADVIVGTLSKRDSNQASSILKLNNINIKRMR
jgi:tRNA A37 threonylcarbamoyladenosine synthetase subunit TsaC/SUA5/YrdC